MRIAFVTDTYLPEINGVTTVVARMRRGLEERGHQVLVIAPRYPQPGSDERGVVRRPSMRCPAYSAIRLTLPWDPAVDRALSGFDPDLVHVVVEGPLGAIGRRFALRQRIPLVTSFHTDFPRYARRYLGDWAVWPASRYLRWFHTPAALTQTPSEVTRRELLALGLDRIVVWGRGVDSKEFTPERRSAARRAALGIGDSTPLVLHVGRLAVEKDTDTLVAAFRLAHERLGGRAVFCVAGDGPRGRLVREALPFARHLGFLDRAALADLYSDGDLFVFPSPTETLGLVVLEAMAAGLPVISSDQGGVLENVRDGINGRLIPAGDAGAFAGAILELLEAPDVRAAMAQAARAFAVGRDWERDLDALVPLYQKVLNGARENPARLRGSQAAAGGVGSPYAVPSGVDRLP